MIPKIIRAILVGLVVWIVCVAFGFILAPLGLPVVSAIGEFLGQFAIPIGALAGLWYFFAGGFTLP